MILKLRKINKNNVKMLYIIVVEKIKSPKNLSVMVVYMLVNGHIPMKA